MPVLSVENLTFTFAHATRPALGDVSFELEGGTVTALVGPNGAGKSTLCYAFAGFIPHLMQGALRGRVLVEGRDTAQTPLAELVTRIGMVFQNPFNQVSGAKLTVSEEVAFGLENLGVPRPEMQKRVARVLELFKLSQSAEQSPYALSGGQQQRLALASIFAMEPPILILDEPTSQLDPAGTREVMEAVGVLATQGVTIVIVEHKLEWVANHASRVLVLSEGRLVADGTPEQVLPRADEWSLVETRYARAGRRARELGLVPSDKPLPLTLEQARAFFAGG
jgi:energy-coupling factor transport system ATP-binding protein